MIEGTDDDLTFGNWENATPEKMKTWTERKLFAAQMHNRGGVYDSWAQAELARRRNLALAELISSLKESTDKVHQEVTVLSSSSDRLEDLTRQLKNLTWALIVLTVAAVIATVVVPIWVERTSDALQAAPVSEPPKQ